MIGELYANGIQLDMREGVAFPRNYSIADQKNPQARKRNYSKTTRLPGSQRNLDFFASTYSLTLSTVSGSSTAGFNYDPTIRIPAIHKNKGVADFVGLLQLTEVVLENGGYEFEVTLFSNYIELFMALGDLKVSELGWSEYDHPLTRTMVKNSWGTSVRVNGVDTPNFSGGNPLGFGYVYGMVDYGYTRIAPKTFRTSDLVPLIYKREAVIKCLELSGIDYDSNFMDSTLFRKALLGFGGGDKMSISTTEISNRRTKFTGTTSTVLTRTANPITNSNGNTYATFYFLSSSFNSIDTDNGFTPSITNDVYDQYDPSTGIITIERSGTYKLSLTQTLNAVLNTGSMTYVEGLANLSVTITRNGSFLTTASLNNTSTFGTLNVDKLLTLQLNAGDAIEVKIYVTGSLKMQLSGGPETIEDLTLTLTDSPDLSFDLTSQQTTLNDNDTIEVSRFIPEMKASEFLAGVIAEFNLYVSDPDIDNVVSIEPLTDFYKSTDQFEDWSKLVDLSKEVIIKPSSSIEGKFYKFNFAEDGDFDNKRYRDRFGVGYGDYIYTVESTWQKGDRVYQLPFAQTIPTDALSPLVVPRIISVDEETGNVKPFKGKPRVYFWNGLKQGGWRLINSSGYSPNDLTTFDDLTTYPAVHHFDDFQNPSFDLNWSLPLELQYVTNVITNANMFNNYHRTFLKEMTGKDSKIIQVYIKLNSRIINKLDFGKLIMINDVLYRLNQISDFDDNIDESTLVELIKVIEAKKPKTFRKITISKKTKIDSGLITSPPTPLPGVPQILPGVISGGKPGVSLQNVSIIKG